MSELTRRTVLSGAAAATLAPFTMPLPAFAAAPPAGTQVPGWYRYKVGAFEITVVTDGVNRFKLPDDMVANAKKEDVNAALPTFDYPADVLQAVRTAFAQVDRLDLGMSFDVIRTGKAGAPPAYEASSASAVLKRLRPKPR